MRRWLFLLLLLPNGTGCLGYVYPTIVYTPELPVDNRDGNAHVFRVDIDRTESRPWLNSTQNNSTSSQYTLSKIPLDRGGLVPSQLEFAPTTGVWNPFGLGDAKEHERNVYTMVIRFYKPGSQTMEVASWDKTKSLQWLPASDLLAQEKAIDDLLRDPAAPTWPSSGYSLDGVKYSTWWELKDQKDPRLGMQPGSASIEQRKTLLFAATEYQRLANGPLALSPQMETVKQRLQQKAIWLRRYAEQAQ